VGGTLPPRIRKRLRYLMPSLPQSLIVRLVIHRIFTPLSWKTGMESRINPPSLLQGKAEGPGLV